MLKKALILIVAGIVMLSLNYHKDVTANEFKEIRVEIPTHNIDTQFWTYTSFLQFHLQTPSKVTKYPSGGYLIHWASVGLKQSSTNATFLYGYFLVIAPNGKDAISIVEYISDKKGAVLESNYYIFLNERPSWINFTDWVAFIQAQEKMWIEDGKE